MKAAQFSDDFLIVPFRVVEGVIQTEDYIPNEHRSIAAANYRRAPTSVVGTWLLRGVNHINRVFNAVFNRRGLSAEASRKFTVYERFLGMNRSPQGIVLDIGCGRASLLLWWARQHPACLFIGLDVNLDDLKTAAAARDAQSLHNLVLVQGRIQRQLFRPGLFSRVVSTQVFEHFSPDALRAAFGEIERLTGPGALILIEVPGRLFMESGFWFYRVLSRIPFLRHRYHILKAFRETGTYPAFEKHNHYVPGYSETGFVAYLSPGLCFRNHAYTINALTAWCFYLGTLAKHYRAYTFILEHLLSKFESLFCSKKAGLNLILCFQRVQPPAHVFGSGLIMVESEGAPQPPRTQAAADLV